MAKRVVLDVLDPWVETRQVRDHQNIRWCTPQHLVDHKPGTCHLVVSDISKQVGRMWGYAMPLKYLVQLHRLRLHR